MIDLTNCRINSWSVISETKRSKSNQRVWLCRCVCGKEVGVIQGNLVSGKSKKCKSCSLKKEVKLEDNRLYSTWKSMLNRCNNKNNSSYKYYGGRGIKVCERWKKFILFLEDMESSFKEGLTLDRKDNNDNYTLENCKWSTSIEQATNQRGSLSLLYKGLLVTEAELSRITGVKRTTIQRRRNSGYSVDEMVLGKNKKQ